MTEQNNEPAARVARQFSKLLLDEIGRKNLDEVVRRNRKEHARTGVCSSHDFCDANMVMLDAFHELGLRTCIDYDGWDGSTRDGAFPAEVQAAMDLWNRAWSLAKAAGFDPSKIN